MFVNLKAAKGKDKALISFAFITSCSIVSYRCSSHFDLIRQYECGLAVWFQKSTHRAKILSHVLVHSTWREEQDVLEFKACRDIANNLSVNQIVVEIPAKQNISRIPKLRLRPSEAKYFENFQVEVEAQRSKIYSRVWGWSSVPETYRRFFGE